jgi:hypothetical protein
MTSRHAGKFAGLTNGASELLQSRLRFAQLKRSGLECDLKCSALKIELNLPMSQREQILDPEQSLREIERL